LQPVLFLLIHLLVKYVYILTEWINL